jgi:predicted metal-dependent hydrolase
MASDRKIAFDFGEVTFKKSERSSNIRIKVHPKQGVVVSVPPLCAESRAINFVIEKELWIRKCLAKMAKTREKFTLFTPSSNFSTHSHSLILKTHSRQTMRMEVTGASLIVYYPQSVSFEHERVQEFTRIAILKTLRFEAKKYLPERTKELAKKHAYTVNEVKVRDNKTRWGSCSGKNNINLNIHLMRLPQELIDYVILHELVHTKVKDHSAKYWVTMEKVLPGARMLDKRLNKYNLVYW